VPTVSVPKSAPDGTVIYLGELIYRGDYIRVDMDLLA
jgi:hypothetical protein